MKKNEEKSVEWVGDNTIVLRKELNELDRFVIKFKNIIERRTKYVIVSGYVSILFGRARATEDIDIFIEDMEKKSFGLLYAKIRKEGFWCLNAESESEVYTYLREGIHVRFAKEGEVIPNIEIGFAKKGMEKEALENPLKVKVGKETINISQLEQQVAFKRYFLKSEKDLEDARHVEEVFKDKINKALIEGYRLRIENEKA